MNKPTFQKVIFFLSIIFLSVNYRAVFAGETKEESLFKSAQESQRSQKWDESLVKFNKIIAQDPNSVLAHKARIEVGKYHKYHRDWQKAIDQYRQVVSLAPHSRQAHDAMTAEAAIHYFRQDFQQALDIFQSVYEETTDWDQIKYCSYWIKEIRRKMDLSEEEQFSCGKESVKLVLNLLKIETDTEELNKLFSGKKIMLSLEDITKVISQKGLKPKVVKVNSSDILNLDTPFIAVVEPEHYVVVTAAKETEVEFIDPALPQSTRKARLGEFAKDFKGYALIFLDETKFAKAEFKEVSEKELREIKGGVCWCCPPGSLGTHPNVTYDGQVSCSLPGMPSWKVNTVTLNFLVQDMDFEYSARGMPVEFIRTYNSDDPREGIFGRSWTFNYNVSLVENPDKSIDIRRGDGRIDHFFWNGTAYQGPKTVYDKLVKNGDGTYALMLKGSKVTENFNPQGKLVSILDKNGNAITFSYDVEGMLVTITDPNSKAITLSYNAAKKVSQITLPDGRFVTFIYDANNNLIQSTDMAQATSSITYDSASYITGITTPHKGATTISYSTSSAGKAVSTITDEQGNKRTYGTYQSHYQVRVLDSLNNATLYYNTYDGYNSSITSQTGNKVTFEYDSLGNRIKIKDVQGNSTALVYDGRGNVLSVTDPLNNKISLTYDDNDNVLSATDAKGKVSTFTYDAKGNLLSAKDPDLRVTSFEYNAYGRPVRLTDPNNAKTDFIYDTTGNLTKMTDPLGKFTAYTYETLGRLKTLTDPKGQTFSYAYDGVDHLTQVINPDLTTAQYTFNCCNLIEAADSSGTLKFTYDSLGRLTGFTNQDNKTLGYSYNSEGNLAKLTYPDGKEVQYEYDADNRLIKVTDWLSNLTEYKYDSLGNLSLAVSPGLITLYKYDITGRLTKLINYNRNTFVITSGFEFTADANSNRTNIKKYLPLKNPAFPTQSASYSYNSDNQLTSATGKSFSYDFNGNMTSIVGTPALGFTYNFLNQLTQYTNGTSTLNYQYDVLGNRIKKTADSTTTNYIVNPASGLPSVLAETNSSGAITTYYVYGLGLISKIDGTNPYYYQYDGLGSTVAITDKTGAIKNTYAYDDFGNLASNSTETISNPFKYVGQYGVMTDAADLLFMRARYYIPSVGRFINKDPIGDINPYLYVGGNPINAIDPLGLFRNPWDIYDDATSIEVSTRLPGRHNGLADAFRHCLASCMMTKENGEAFAKAFGWANEKRGDWFHHQEKGERKMDDFNNASGRCFGKTASNTRDCTNSCMNAALSGQLQTYTSGSTPSYGK